MPITAPLAHIDISVGYPEKSIPFYAAFFETLGYRRWNLSSPQWQGTTATRATWGIKYANGGRFDVEVRPARHESRDRAYDRYEPGPHHLAFHAEDRATVERVHQAMIKIGATVLDPPTDYRGQDGYGDDYFAVFFADPDGLKLEVACIPKANP
jgi:glyoxylase I family protein